MHARRQKRAVPDMVARPSREGSGTVAASPPGGEFSFLPPRKSRQICLAAVTALMASYAASEATSYPVAVAAAAGRLLLRVESALSPPPSTLWL